MTTRFIILSSLLVSSAALAQPSDTATSTPELAPISNAIELAVGGGYMQGVGDIGGGMSSVHDLARSGGGADLSLGYRFTPNLALAAYSTLSGYKTGSDVAPTTDLAIGATLGVKADWHFRPTTSSDPWVSVGTGWRALWLGNDDATEQKFQGIDIARLQLGVDFRVTRGIALSPYVGASATTFLRKADAMSNGYESIDDKKISWAFAGGLLARFDIATR